MKSLKQIAAVASLTSFLAAPAFAGPGNGNHYGNGNGAGYGNHYGWSQSSYSYVRSMNFALTQVSARLHRRELTVRFRADEQSFRFANRSGISPKLRIETAGQLFEVPIAQVEGFASFTLPRWADPREMTISVSGANGRFRIDTVSLGGAASSRITVPVERIRDERPNHGGGHHQQPPRWSFLPAVITACGNAFEGQYNEMECLRVADGFAFNPVDTINTCEIVMEGDANELACLRTAVRSAVPRIPALNACEIAMEGDANELACFAKATVARFEAKSTIDACEYAFDGDHNELACMDSAFRYAFNPVPVIQSCEASMDGDAAELACLARY